MYCQAQHKLQLKLSWAEFSLILTFPNIYVLIDYIKKTLGYRGSCVVTFENLELFRFLRGLNRGFPPKISKKKNSLKPV